MRRTFTSYTSAGLITAALTAAIFVQFNWIAFPILGLTVGIAVRSVRLCLIGLFTSAGIACLVFVSMCLYTDTPQPPALEYFGLNYVAMLFGSSIGAALQLQRRKLVIGAIISNIVSLAVVTGLSLILRWMLPPELRMLEKWEYITIVLSVPVIGFGTWWPVDVMVNSASHPIQASQ